MKSSILATGFSLAAALALTGCGGGATEVSDPNDPEQIAAAIASIPKHEPGQFQFSGELLEFEMPGGSDEEAAMMRSMMEMMAGGGGMSLCLTQEMVDTGHEAYLNQLKGRNQDCQYTSFSVDGDQLSAEMSCGDGVSAEGSIIFAGTINANGSDMTVTTDVADPTTGQGIKMKLNQKVTRTGECTSEPLSF